MKFKILYQLTLKRVAEIEAMDRTVAIVKFNEQHPAADIRILDVSPEEGTDEAQVEEDRGPDRPYPAAIGVEPGEHGREEAGHHPRSGEGQDG